MPRPLSDIVVLVPFRKRVEGTDRAIIDPSPLVLPRNRSKGEGEAHRAVLLGITCGRSAIADERGVGVAKAGGDWPV